jgi:serine/threonine protein kinase
MNRRLAGRPLSVDMLLEAAVQIADALDTAHTRGIVHRDLKPANVLVTTRGQVKILDFAWRKKIRRVRGPREKNASNTSLSEAV